MFNAIDLRKLTDDAMKKKEEATRLKNLEIEKRIKDRENERKKQIKLMKTKFNKMTYNEFKNKADRMYYTLKDTAISGESTKDIIKLERCDYDKMDECERLKEMVNRIHRSGRYKVDVVYDEQNYKKVVPDLCDLGSVMGWRFEITGEKDCRAYFKW